MISDVLHEAITDIDYYLTEPAFAYTGPMRARILACCAEMAAIENELWGRPPAIQDAGLGEENA